MKPEDLNPVRDVLRSVREYLKGRFRKSGESESAGKAVSERKSRRTRFTLYWKVFGRLVTVFVWLLLVSLVCSLLFSLFPGRELASTRVSRFANLWIHYAIRGGGIWPDRLDYVVVSEIPLRGYHHSSKGRADVLMLVFADQIVSLNPRRGETLWIDTQGEATSLGRVLHLEDVRSLENRLVPRKHPINSPDEFLDMLAE